MSLHLYIPDIPFLTLQYTGYWLQSELLKQPQEDAGCTVVRVLRKVKYGT